ncbi:MAG: hypothetical protein HY811_09980 [Planctomycetes bacterium]|nr:hypothetical protein [Planctomycetota bacterium]
MRIIRISVLLILTIAAAVLIIQNILLLTLSDDDYISFSNASLRTDMKIKNSSPEFIKRTIDEMNSDRERFLQSGSSFVLRKSIIATIIAFLFLILTWGVFTNRKTLTRIAALICSVVSIVGIIYGYESSRIHFKIYEEIIHLSFSVKLLFFATTLTTIMIPFVLVFSVISIFKPPVESGLKIVISEKAETK